jgi:DNA repair exonuclease SbcCD ATPase subunit
MELLALSDIARRTGIPAPTARRYAALFKDFLSGRRLGRMTRYPEDALVVFQRISELYSQGRITAEIEDMLRQEFPRTIEVGPSTAPIALPAVTESLPSHLAEALSDALSEALSSSISHFTDALEKLAEQKTNLDSHQTDIDKLKNGFVLLARNLKRLARRDQADISEQMDALFARLKDIEPKLAVMEEISLTLTSDNADLKARLSAQEVELRRLREDRDRLEILLKRVGGLPG